MTDDLLSKEKGFRQLNKELEQKAQNLMKKIDCVISTYSNPKKNHVHITREKTDHSRNLTTQDKDNSRVSVKRNSSLPHIFDQSATLKSNRNVGLQEDHTDDAFNKFSVANKTIVNTLKAKIDMLQNELQTLRTEYKKKCDTCKDLESENKKLEIKLKTDIETLKETIIKLENNNKTLQCDSQGLNTENAMLKKDLDKLQKQIKVTNQQSNTCTMRLNRSLENNDKLKNALKYSEIREKELKTQMRKLQEDKRLTVNNLGKQLSELIQVFKKQMLIVDNLKKQNVCICFISFTQNYIHNQNLYIVYIYAHYLNYIYVYTYTYTLRHA
ncbi:unnamed protein product [Xylocopa violacea]|uniref:Uncharacterized protein n=1 Tax=Xylocopa violacea TaxID=135666 RepID=A0ABP1NJI9_XYLVO